MLKEILLKLKGFSIIDETPAVHSISSAGYSKNPIGTFEKCVFRVWYNEKSKKFSITTSGFRPRTHAVFIEFKALVNYMNNEFDLEDGDPLEFYYDQKDYLMYGGGPEDTELEFEFAQDNIEFLRPYQSEFDKLAIVRFPLDHDYEALKEKFLSEDYYKKSFLLAHIPALEKEYKNMEIFDRVDNTMATSEGIFIATEKSNFNLNNSLSNESI